MEPTFTLKTTADGPSLILPILAAVATMSLAPTEVTFGMPFWMHAGTGRKISEKGTRARPSIQTNTRTAISGRCGRAAKSDAPTGMMKSGLARWTRKGSILKPGFYVIAHGYHLDNAYTTATTAWTTPTR